MLSLLLCPLSVLYSLGGGGGKLNLPGQISAVPFAFSEIRLAN